MLVARYAASRITDLRKDGKFLDVVQDWGEFARDLIEFVASGQKVQGLGSALKRGKKF